MSIEGMQQNQGVVGGNVLRVCITGSSAGIGLAAATRLIQEGHVVYHACRNPQQAVQASGGGIPLQCDLANLDSVRACSHALPPDLDVLCLNAGMAPSTVATSDNMTLTKQGFEECIGVNHIGHFLLANLLFSQRKMPPRLVVTSSSVHDPDTKGGKSGGGQGADLGDMVGLGMDLRQQEAALGSTTSAQPTMVNGATEYSGGKVYKDSKLCNLLFAREAAKRYAAGTLVCAFNPGFIPTTGLFDSLRERSPLSAWALTTVANMAGWSVPLRVGGNRLYRMITLPSANMTNGDYFAAPAGSRATDLPDFGPTKVSKDASNDELARKLWERTNAVVQKWLR